MAGTAIRLVDSAARIGLRGGIYASSCWLLCRGACDAKRDSKRNGGG
jgi:hypothetical protein